MTLPPYHHWSLHNLLWRRINGIEESYTKSGPVLLLSHQSASDTPTPAPQNTRTNSYTNTNGTPLTYKDWFSGPPEPTTRSTPTPHGAKVACCPSSGGIWIKHVNLLDMHFLDLNRFSKTPRQSDQRAEDAFCGRLAMLDADWRSLPPRPETKKLYGLCRTLELCFTPSVTTPYLVAYPRGHRCCVLRPYLSGAREGRRATEWVPQRRGYAQAMCGDKVDSGTSVLL
jgi:hypothetical protein